jgi:hypothetical protein
LTRPGVYTMPPTSHFLSDGAKGIDLPYNVLLFLVQSLYVHFVYLL